MKSTFLICAILQLGRALGALPLANLTQQYFGNDAPWYWDRIPLFESSDQTMMDVYYYRWKVFRSHQRDLGPNGYITVEFLNDVSWQTYPWGALNDAVAFHILEGRWCRDRRFKNDYASFMYNVENNMHQYSEHVADAVWQGYQVALDGDTSTPLLPAMKSVYAGWANNFNTSANLYWIEPLADATEFTIASIDASGGSWGFTGGQGYRPSINSYQYANALAISAFANLTGDAATAGDFAGAAQAIKTNVQNSLWNSNFQHFVDRFANAGPNVTTWDQIRGRELVGYTPWTHNLPDDTTDFAQAWKHVLDTSELAGEHALRTNEPSYQYYMVQYRYLGPGEPECQWNGPAWPFQETQVLAGLANLLDHYPTSASAGIIGIKDYNNLLRQYALLHYNPKRGGELDIEEDYDAATGAPIVGLSRSPHYFHSGFIDLVLSGYVGIRPTADSKLEVNPLADPASVSYFRADRIIYHGHEVAVQWDATGAHYGTAGLQVEVDGTVAASSPSMTRLTVDVAAASPPPYATTAIAQSVQLQNDSATYPQGSVDVPGASQQRIHDAIDGRIHFFPEPEVMNGYDTPTGNDSTTWFQIDFSADHVSVSTRSAELAFFANADQGYAVPTNYTIQVPDGGNGWTDVANAVYAAPVDNGITYASWDDVAAPAIRLVFTPTAGSMVRLIEFKVYSDLVTAPTPPSVPSRARRSL